MTNHYKTRKKKEPMPVRHTKIVRIDAKTSIEVSVSIPDDIARANYIEKVMRSPRSTYVPLTDKGVLQEESVIIEDDAELAEQD